MKQTFRHGSVLKLTRYDTAETIERDFSLMSERGIDTVVIWPAAFWWEEKKEGYPFNTGKLVLELAERHGLKIVMELAGQLTAMEYAPDFLMKPEYYATDVNGHRAVGQSSFGFLRYYHPEVKEMIRKHYRAAAEAYRDYPALIGYDIFNETMHSSYDEHTMGEFRLWLKNKYGTLERLNEVWERTYSEWDQIVFESWKWMSVMPEADYAEFRKASMGIILEGWKQAILEVDDTHMLIADNIHSNVVPGVNFARPQDDFDLKRVVGEIGMSFYPKQIPGTRSNDKRWEIFDGFYAASQRDGFYISEMQTHIQAMFNYTTCCRPYELKRWCYEAYSAGAKALIWWMWRPFDKGLQTMGRGLVDYKGRPTERLDAAEEIGNVFAENGALTPVRSEVGILYDAQADNLSRPLSAYHLPDKDIYLSSIHGAYRAIWDANYRADIVTLEELGEYRAVVLTNSIVMDDLRAEALRAYVEQGGTLIVDGRFGVIDPYSQLSTELPGGALNDLCGEEFVDSDYKGVTFTYRDLSVSGGYGRDLMRLNDGEAIAFFEDGYPAIVRRSCGKGQVLFLNCQLWYGYHMNQTQGVRELTRALLDELEISVPEIVGSIKLRVARGNGKLHFFLFNYTEEEQAVKVNVTVEGKPYTLEATVAPNDSVILTREEDHE